MWTGRTSRTSVTWFKPLHSRTPSSSHPRTTIRPFKAFSIFSLRKRADKIKKTDVLVETRAVSLLLSDPRCEAAFADGSINVCEGNSWCLTLFVRLNYGCVPFSRHTPWHKCGRHFVAPWRTASLSFWPVCHLGCGLLLPHLYFFFNDGLHFKDSRADIERTFRRRSVDLIDWHRNPCPMTGRMANLNNTFIDGYVWAGAWMLMMLTSWTVLITADRANGVKLDGNRRGAVPLPHQHGPAPLAIWLRPPLAQLASQRVTCGFRSHN